jgi:hypothetical protein
MKSTIVVLLIIIASALILFEGCATVFKGYEDEVILTKAPKGLRVFTKDSVEIPVQTVLGKGAQAKKTIIMGLVTLYDSTVVVETRKINLRSNTDHVLILKYQDKEKRLRVYPKISTSWFILDLLTGGFFVDAYTGNWNCFDNIYATFNE